MRWGGGGRRGVRACVHGLCVRPSVRWVLDRSVAGLGSISGVFVMLHWPIVGHGGHSIRLYTRNSIGG